MDRLKIEITYDVKTGELGLHHNVGNPVVAYGMLEVTKKTMDKSLSKPPVIVPAELKDIQKTAGAGK